MPLDRPLVVLDTETATTGGAPHLLELAAVRVEEGEIADRFEELVLPRVPVAPEATEVHGITDDDVRSADEAGPVLERFVAWAGDAWLCAHDARFDATVLSYEAARHGVEPPGAPFLDTLRIARRYLPEASDHRLETLGQLLDLEGDERHRALPDAVWCWKVLEECVERARATGGDEAASAARLLAVGGAPITCARFGPGRARLKRRHRGLAEAVASGAEVTLVYGDSGASPASLPVLPRLLFERSRTGYLEAECVRSGLVKTYRLDRVHGVR